MNNIREINENKFNKLKTDSDKIRFLLQYAILAPSTHNTQPWLFRIGENYCDILCNPEKKLPKSDKSGRGFYISIGCCAENLIIIASYFKVYERLDLVFNKNHIARIYFRFRSKNVLNKKQKELVKAILVRSNRRGVFREKKIPDSFTSKLLKISINYPNVSLHVLENEDEKNLITELTVEGIIRASKDTHFRSEIASWINSNVSNRSEGMPGYAFNLPLLPSLIFSSMMKYLNLGKLSAKLSKLNLKSASIICVITSDKNDKIGWFETGRLAERIMLEGYQNNISSTINFGAIEVDDLYRGLMTLLKTNKRPQFLFSMGYMKSFNRYTPRIAAVNKIIS